MKKKSLPPGLIVRLGKFVWTTMWQIMMSQLAPSNKTGDYQRPQSQFRNSIGDEKYPGAANRYRLYVGMGCPWAHRTLVVRALKGLEDVIEVVVAKPSSEAGIWVLEAASEGCHTLPELYQKAKPGYTGRSTVPVLWDTQTQTIVNNESAEIIVMLNAQFNAWATRSHLDLYPKALQADIEAWNEKIYPAINNGVYRCGFAQSQEAYNRATTELFDMLDEIEAVLASSRYLSGETVTLADIRLFTTLFRFDIVYYNLFKCNRRRIQDYQHLGAYVRDLYQLPDVAQTCDLEAVKRDYYGNLFPLNPGGIIPCGPEIEILNLPHGRENLAIHKTSSYQRK